MRRVLALEAAKDWLLTPYQHGASVKGVGCDCAGLIRGVWREVVGPERWEMPSYGPDWAERDPGSEILWQVLAAEFVPVGVEDLAAGMVMAFRMQPRGPVKHLALFEPGAGGGGQLIHAYFGRAVVRSALVPFWRSRLVAVFDWP